AFRRQQAARATPADTQGAFRSLPEGLSELVRALVRALPSESIKCASPVARLVACRREGTVVRPEAATVVAPTEARDSVTAFAVGLAVPAYMSARLIRPLDSALADLFDAVSYASTGPVALAFSRDAVTHPLNGSGFVVPRAEHSGILAASWLSSKWPNRAPEGRVLVRTFVGGARDPQALDRSDNELVELSVRALTPLLGL